MSQKEKTWEVRIPEEGGYFLLLIRVVSFLAAVAATYIGLSETLADGFWGKAIALAMSFITAAIAYWAWGRVPKMPLGKQIATVLIASLFVIPGSVYWTAIFLGSRAAFFDELKEQSAPLDQGIDLVVQQMANERGIESHLESAAARFDRMAMREALHGDLTGFAGTAGVAIALSDVAAAMQRAHEALATSRLVNEAKLADLQQIAVSLKRVAIGGKLSLLDKQVITYGAQNAPAAAMMRDLAARQEKLFADKEQDRRRKPGDPFYSNDSADGIEKEMAELQVLEDVSLTEGYQLVQRADTLLAEIRQDSQRTTLQALIITLQPVLSQATADDERIATAQRAALESVRDHLEATRAATQAAIDGYPEKPPTITVAPAHILVLTHASAIPGQWLLAFAVDYGPLILLLFFRWTRPPEAAEEPKAS